MDEEAKIKKFVQKRTSLHVLKICSLFGVLIFAAIANGFFSQQIKGPYQDMYISIIMVWVLWGSIIMLYTGTVLSQCPVCRRDLKTMQYSQRGRNVRIWVDPLPNYCPHCGADFSKHNKYRV